MHADILRDDDWGPPLPDQNPVSVAGWGSAIIVGILMWVLIFLAIRAF